MNNCYKCGITFPWRAAWEERDAGMLLDLSTAGMSWGFPWHQRLNWLKLPKISLGWGLSGSWMGYGVLRLDSWSSKCGFSSTGELWLLGSFLVDP